MASFTLSDLANRPLAIHPDYARGLFAGVSCASDLAQLPIIDGIQDDEAQNVSGYQLIDGLAVIRIYGLLLQKYPSPVPMLGVTGYGAIRAALNRALDDDAVNGIILDIDSFGGDTAGMFDLSDTIYAARKQKPISAILSENAFSAAYALASAASKVYVPRTGGTGSIGVVAMHIDMSRTIKSAGFLVTLIQYGVKKTDFSDMKPLSKSALETAQAEVDVMGRMFDELIARNRGLSVRSVHAMQADTFMGQAGIDAGLADWLMAPDQAFARVLSSTAPLRRREKPRLAH